MFTQIYKQKIYKLIVKLGLFIHSKSYGLIKMFVAKAEGGRHPKHNLMRYHDFFVDNINTDDTVLDVGCGRGEVAFDVAKKAKRVIGIDIKEKNIKIAKEKHSADNLEYIIGDATNVGGSTSYIRFDVIILSNVLEHLDGRVEFLNKIKKLAPKMLIRVPMVNRDWLTLYKKQLGMEYRLSSDHKIEYTIEIFRDEIEKAGLKIESFSVQFGEIWAVAGTIYDK